MKINVDSISTRDKLGMVLVKVSLTAEREQVWDGGRIELFLPAKDSVAEIRRLAVEKLREFAQEILDAPAAETAEPNEGDLMLKVMKDQQQEGGGFQRVTPK
jgi:hypothetical protein